MSDAGGCSCDLRLRHWYVLPKVNMRALDENKVEVRSALDGARGPQNHPRVLAIHARRVWSANEAIALSGTRSSHPCVPPGHMCSSVSTPPAHRRKAYSTFSSRKTSAEPTSIYVDGRPERSAAR